MEMWLFIKKRVLVGEKRFYLEGGLLGSGGEGKVLFRWGFSGEGVRGKDRASTVPMTTDVVIIYMMGLEL